MPRVPPTHQLALPPGAKLPPVRRLAGDLGLAPNTVARAFRELEAAGLVETQGRRGTIVAGRGESALAHAATASFVAAIRAQGLSLAAAQQLVAEHWG